MTQKYHYIITGAGAAGLSLLVRLVESGKFKDKKILLVDRVHKKQNDRTWCFWEKGTGVFEDVVFKRWDKLWFHASGCSLLNNIGPYTYKLIRGIDFYDYCFHLIRTQPNITVSYGEVMEVFSNPIETGINFEGQKILADYVFNSIQFEKTIPVKGRQYLLQHFKGYFIEARENIFNASEATLMDFRVPQKMGTTFFYVMPFSPTTALVEYTVFSEKILGQDEYDAAIENYCENILGITGYKINSTEFGVIPMTDHPFERINRNVINMGTAGGQTKASSGYTFQFIQKNSAQIVQSLITRGTPFFPTSLLARRFNWYDSVLLHVLAENKMPGETIFRLMLQKNPMKRILKFLDNETSISEELKVISPLPKIIFAKAALTLMVH